MRLSHLGCEGFRGICDPFEVSLPAGFLVVTGPNGAGKSTLCDLIEFSITGRMRRQKGETERNETIEDYVWWRGETSPRKKYVSVGLVDQDGNSVEVVRTPKGLEKPREKDLVQFLCKPPVAADSPLEDLLRTAIIRDEEITKLSVDLAETERFRFVRSAIGETILPQYAEDLGGVCKVLGQRAAQYEGQYLESRERISRLLEQIAELKADVASTSEIEEARSKLASYVGIQASIEPLLSQGRSAVVDLRQQADTLGELAERMQEIDEEASRLVSTSFLEEREQLQAKQEETRTALSEISEARAEQASALQKLASRTPDMAAWAQLIERGQRIGLRGNQCPLCGSTISQANFDVHITEARERIQREDEELMRITAKHSQTEGREHELTAELGRLEQRLISHDRLADVIASRREKLRQELAALLGGSPLPGTSKEILTETEARRERAREIERLVSILESSRALQRVAELEETLREVRAESDSTQRHLRSVRAAHDKAKAARDAVRRIEGELMEERLAALGPLLEELYLRLRPHAEWLRLRYRIRGDVRRFLSLEVGEALNPRFMFSSGQRRAIGIAFLLAVYLSTDWSRLRTVVLDDPIQHIDDYRALHLVELLNALRKADRQILCTTEDRALAELVARRLQGIREESGALLVLQYEPGRGVRIEDQRIVRPNPEQVLLSA